jgi:hypothetical protein
VTHNAPISSYDLLRRLTPVAPPVSVPDGDSAPTLFESRTFDQLLGQVVRGEIRSDRPVQCSCELQPPLTSGQMQRLADAGDRAEASGARSALMMIDGRGLVVDVAERVVRAEVLPDDARGVWRVDAALVVPADNAETTQATVAPDGLFWRNPSVARLLQESAHTAPNRPDGVDI